MVPGTAKNPPNLRRMRPTQTMKSFRRPAFVLVPLALAAALLAFVGSVAAQSNTGGPPAKTNDETNDEADKAKAETDKRQADAAARAEAARKAEARKPKRDQNGDRKDPERELEEEEDI